MLLIDGILATLVLPSLKAGDRSLIHEVVPASNGEAWDVHFVEMQRAVFGLPVVIVGGMCEPLGQQTLVIFRVTSDAVHSFEANRTSRAANPVTFLEQTQTGITHVLTNQMRRLSHCKIVLSVSSLRTSKRTDLAGTPFLLREPFARVVPILKFAPLQRPITNPRSL